MYISSPNPNPLLNPNPNPYMLVILTLTLSNPNPSLMFFVTQMNFLRQTIWFSEANVEKIIAAIELVEINQFFGCK